jgi:hypothetical protein
VWWAATSVFGERVGMTRTVVGVWKDIVMDVCKLEGLECVFFKDDMFRCSDGGSVGGKNRNVEAFICKKNSPWSMIMGNNGKELSAVSQILTDHGTDYRE